MPAVTIVVELWLITATTPDCCCSDRGSLGKEGRMT